MPPKKRKAHGEADDDDEYIPEKRVIAPRSSKGNSVSNRGASTSASSVVSYAQAANYSSEYFASIPAESLLDGTFGCLDLSKSLTLKPDHEMRPIWVTTNNVIILEAFSKHYAQAYDFLINIAEPIARPTYFHSYRLTEDSLYSAIAVSRDTDSIIKYLKILCKTEVPLEVETYIRTCTQTFGKAKLVLKDNKFFIESKYPDVLRELLKNPIISGARLFEDAQTTAATTTVTATGSASAAVTGQDGFVESIAPIEDRRNIDLMTLDEEDDEILDMSAFAATSGVRTVSFMVNQEMLKEVKRSAKEDSKYPLMEEYDFRADHINPNLVIDLRPSTIIRPYQEKSLSKMFGNGRARSGIIVLPCGAGKSLTGVTAASTVKKATIVLCINNASVKQWKEQFTLWTNLSESKIRIFTSSQKDALPQPNEACVVITTYSMVCHSGHRSESAMQMMNSLTRREWGLMILDEVHVAPADMFQKVMEIVNAHCKLGLTATLVREDNKIKDLSFLVGPKLYEANWMDLTNEQYLARAQCVEVWCPMTKEFYAEYIRCGFKQLSHRTQKLLYVMNPTKFRVCEFLVRFHTNRRDKIIVFSDDLPALFFYCELMTTETLAMPVICGATPEEQRRSILQAFKTDPKFSVLGLSSVGDTALDIPEANVVIQVSSHFGARRQEAQRLGRILRPKPNPTGEFNAFFYSLVSTDTREMYFSSKRQQYLIDQGYTFKVVQDLAARADCESEIMKTKEQEMEVLRLIFKYSDAVGIDDAVERSQLERSTRGEDDAPNHSHSHSNSNSNNSNSNGFGSEIKNARRRRVTDLSTVAGGADGLLYAEFSADR